MRRFPHLPVLSVLALLFAGTVYVAFSGTFRVYNEQGILSGPFSALLILAALELALLALVALDWRVWQPQRDARRRGTHDWLTREVLQTTADPEWRELQGKFRGRRVVLQRVPGASVGVRFMLPVDSTLSLRIVRLEQPAQLPANASNPYDTGDAAFEERYAWQTAQPDAALLLLKQPPVRDAFKRLASLAADRETAPHKGGVALENGVLSVLQLPAPWLAGNSFANPHEVLLILADLALLGAALEGKTLPGSPPVTAQAATAPASGGGLSLGCIAGFWLALWLGVTYALGRHVALSAGMVSFFLPPVVLALLFMAASAARAGRDPEIEDALRAETAAALQRDGELAALAGRLKMLP